MCYVYSNDRNHITSSAPHWSAGAEQRKEIRRSRTGPVGGPNVRSRRTTGSYIDQHIRRSLRDRQMTERSPTHDVSEHVVVLTTMFTTDKESAGASAAASRPRRAASVRPGHPPALRTPRVVRRRRGGCARELRSAVFDLWKPSARPGTSRQ